MNSIDTQEGGADILRGHNEALAGESDGMTPADSDVVIQRILAAFKVPLAIDGHEMVVSASIEIAYSTVEDIADSLLRDADVAMYQAKRWAKGMAPHGRFERHPSR